MFKLNRCLLSALSIVAINTVPMQTHAQVNVPKGAKIETNSKKTNQVEKYNTKKLRITANKEQKETIEQALQSIYSTPIGKELLKKLPYRFEIAVEDVIIKRSGGLSTTGQYSSKDKKIRLHPKLLSDGFGLSVRLVQEMCHCNQDRENRMNRGQVGDGIEGYVDFVTRKLREVERKLVEVIYIAESGYNETDSKYGECAMYYLDLKEKYKNQGLDEDKAIKMAKTEYVRVLWESSASETEGPREFSRWVSRNEKTFNSESKIERVGKRDAKKEYNLIQSFIKAMDIDLDVAYFLNTKNWHLPDEQLAFHTDREQKTLKIKNESCLQFCKEKETSKKKEKPKTTSTTSRFRVTSKKRDMNPRAIAGRQHDSQ